jgi:hypothetical protein
MKRSLFGGFMRRNLGFAFLALVISGCGSGTKMMNPTDMTVASDIAMAPLTCLGLGSCILDCLNTGPTGTGDMAGSPLQACLDQCAPLTTAVVARDWVNAFNCGIDFCYGVADASVAQCVGQAQDPPGTPGGTCTTCIYNAPFLVLGDFSDPNVVTAPTGMCPNPNSPDCKGGTECTSKFNTCINQM